MSLVPSFVENANAVVVGANGGIGRALVTALADDERVSRVHALARSSVESQSPALRFVETDLTEDNSLATAAAACTTDGPVDLVIVASGILHREPDIRPEKRLQDLDAGALAEVLRINTIGPALVARQFLPLMRRDAKTAFAAISARVGSIGDNRLGGWASYRASKAALNMLIRTFAIEQARSMPDCTVVALHPGTVDTSLSRPFQRNVPDGRLFTPGFAAQRLLSVLDALSPEDTGGLFAWDGSRIEY